VSQDSGLWLRDVPDLDGPHHYKDRAWISAAGAAPAGCVFVTGNRRLLGQLGESDVPDQWGFVPRFITEALVQELAEA
jgi:hypothetical protein